MKLFRNALSLFFIGLSSAMILVFPLPSVASSPSVFTADPGDLSLPFSVDSETQIPGKVLKPGNYTLRVVDHLSDRVVLRVENNTGKSESLFLGLPSPGLGSVSGPVSWGKAGRHAALRGFVFPGGSAVEFVYQKAEAVSIAEATSMKVPAIDPASEGMPVNRELSRDDMAMITLWKLSPTQVGSQKGIEAERYAPPAPAPIQTAQAGPHNATTAPGAGNTSSIAASAPPMYMHKKVAATASTQVAALRRPAPLAVLPHTGSELPELLLAGVGLLAAACSLRFARLAKA